MAISYWVMSKDKGDKDGIFSTHHKLEKAVEAANVLLETGNYCYILEVIDCRPTSRIKKVTERGEWKRTPLDF